MSVSMYERTSVSSLGRGIPTHLPVTEDTPPDYLEGHMQLLCVLPNGKCVDIAVERRTPMMDVLVQICTSRRLAPGDHVLSLTDTAKQNLPFKPSTPIGSLDAHTIHVVAKSRELPNGKVSWPSLKAAQPFEPTIRLQVHLPRNQLHVLRVSPRSTLAEILRTVCEVKALDPDLCEIRHPTNVDERLRLSCCLADYKLQEITIALRDNSPPLSVVDLPAMQSGSSKSLCRPTSEVAACEKKKKGIFGFVFGKKSPRQNGNEFRSPPITDESPMKSETPVKNESPVNKESPAVQASRNSPPRGGHETNGTDMPPPHPPTRIKKRPAPAPPPGSKSSSNAPVVVNGNSGSHSVKEEEKASSVISSSSSTDKYGCPVHSRQGSDSSSGCHESSLVSEREPTQKSLGTSSLSDVAAPPRLRPKLTPGVGQSPRAVSVINLSHSSALHSGPSSNLTKTQSHSHTSLTSASKKRKAPAPPPLSALSSSTVSASATTTSNTTTPTSSVGAGTASHRSSLTDSTVSATSSSIVSSFVAVSTDRAPSRSSNSSAAPVGEKVTDDIFNGGGETGPRSDTSSELSCRDKGTKNLIYRESSAESGEDGIYEQVRPMSKVLPERKPVIEATENQPIEALYSVVVKKPKGVEVLEKNENNFRESVERVNGHQLEPIEALPEKEQEELNEDYIAWEYKLPEPPTPFQDTPITSNLEPMTSASESPSRSLSPDSLSDTTTVTMPLMEEPVRKDVTDAVQDLKWDMGETRTEPEEVEEEVIVPIKVKKSPKSLVVNATEDEPVLVLTEKINEESQTDDNSLELRSDLKEKTESVLDEADQRQETPEAIPDVNCHVVEEKNICEVDDPKMSEIKEIQKTKAKDVEASPPKTRTERKEKREEITEEALDLSLKHFENVAVTERPAPVKETPSSSSSSSRKSSVFSDSDSEEDTDRIITIQQPEMSTTDAASSSGSANFPPVPFTKTSTEKYVESSLDDEHNRDLPPQDKGEKRGSVSSLQKSESLALPSRPKVLKRQASFGANDQELAKVTEISAVTSQSEQMLQHTTEARQELLAEAPKSDTECVPSSSVETITTPAILTKTAEMPVAPPTSSDTAQPVNLELFMQAQQLFSKVAENMGNQQLQEEFIRLQQQFLSWQQQLLTNQQVLQSKLSQSLQAELPKESSASQEKRGEIVEKELEESKQPVTVEAERGNMVKEPSIAASTDKQVWKTCRSFEERLEKKIPSLREESTKKIDIVEEVQVVQENTTTANVFEQPTKLKTEDKMSEKPAIEVEKPVSNAIKSSENQVPKEPIYRYQGPPTIKLEPWRPGRPRSEIIDFSRDASFFLPDQLAQPPETRKSVRELVQQSKLELLIKPPTLPKPSDVKILQSQSSVAPEPKLKVVKEEPKVIVKEESKVIFKEEPKVIVKGEFKVTQENQAQTKSILTKQMTLPSTLVTSKSHDVPSPVTPNQPPADLAPPSAAANVPFRPTLVRRASIGTPKPFELKPAPLRKMQFPIRVPEVRGFAPLKPEVLLSQNHSPSNTIGTTNPKPNNPMRDKLIVSARRPSAELKPLEMEELAKLSEKTATVSPPGPTPAPVPTPPTLPTLRPTPLHKPVMIPKTGLDPREELMIAIRSFSANGGLRKNGNSVLLSGP